MKIAPHIFVGLGGCGSQVVNEIGRKLKRRRAEYDRYRNLVHFFAFDTDMGELKRCEAVDQWIPISQFDKRQFVELGYGSRGRDEDELFTSWWPEYYQPRSTSGAGAGQIRIESRLSVYRTLKAMPQYLTSIRNAIRRAYDANERFRDVDKQPMIHIYSSLAGGTGSGSFLSLAYLLRDLIAPHQNPIVVGTFVMPGVFRGKGLPSQQLDKVMANGYAALMELEYLQGAENSPSGRIRYQYDPNAKEPTFVTHGPFNQVYLVDDVGQLSSVISNPQDVYPHIADAAYTQIFSSIIERDRSTADNDERAISVSDEQHYTKRYGSFGLSALVLPDEDILAYTATRYAAEAIAKAFALTDDDFSGPDRGRDALSPEQREQHFVRELQTMSRLPGDTGRFYSAALEFVDGGGEGGSGAQAEFLRRMDGQLERLDAVLQQLPKITEERLEEYENEPDEVRTYLNKQLDAWKERSTNAKQEVLVEARMLAKELAGANHDHSLGKLVEGTGALRKRYLYIKLESTLRDRQGEADKALRLAKGSLDGWEERYRKFNKALEESAPKTLMERFTGNDYFDEVKDFVDWFNKSLYQPLWATLRADAELELYDLLLEGLGEHRERLASLFSQLSAIRRELLGRCEALLESGVSREEGGQVSEHVLDVEVFQDHLDPDHQRLWNVVYRHRVEPDMFDPEEIARTISAAEAGTSGRRHVREAVVNGLVDLGRRKFRLLITGEHDPRSLDEMGLQMQSSLDEEARISWAWQKLRDRYRSIEDVPDETWKIAFDDVTDARVTEYVRDNLALAARKCAPFWRLSEGATQIEPKRYITVYGEYLNDDTMRRYLTTVPGFDLPEGNLLRTGDPKRIVFYWNEMGVPIYRVESIDECGHRYEYVKMDELRRGPIYHREELRFHSGDATLEESASRCEGHRCPDIPLHTDRSWEGAPDAEACLFPVTMEAVRENRGKKSWEMTRQQHREATDHAQVLADRAEIRAFALCRAMGYIALTQDDGYVWAVDEIQRAEDRVLGAFLDDAREGFSRARETVKGFVLKKLEAKLEEVAATRDRAAIEELIKPHLASLEMAILNAGNKEAAVLKEEATVLEDVLKKLLDRV